MQYILLLHVNEVGWSKLTKAEQERGMAAYIAYTEALKEAGRCCVLLGSAAPRRKSRRGRGAPAHEPRS